LMLSVQRTTIASMAGRLDLVQRDAELALEAQTDRDARLLDLEDQVRRLSSRLAALGVTCCARDLCLLTPDSGAVYGNGAVAGCASFSTADGCGVVLVEGGLPASIPELPWIEPIVGS